MIPFGEYAPDQAQTNMGFSSVANNVVGGVNAYYPIKSPVVASDALPNTPQGASYFYTEDSSRVSIVGDGVALYRLDGQTWVDVKGSVYTGTEINLWSFVQFGSLAIATNGVNNIQKYDVDSGGTFSDLGGTPPKAKYLANVRDFVVAANTDISPFEVHWSAINNAEGWTIGSGSSDQQTFPDGGVIRGVVGGEVGYVFQDRAVRRMTFTSGRLIFRFDKIGNDIGCLADKSIAQHGGKIFFLGTDGFYLLEGDQFTPIGAEKVNRTFFNDLRADYVDNVHAVIDQKGQTVTWFYADKTSVAGSLIANKSLIYNWVTNKWTTSDIESSGIVSSLSVSASLDSGDYTTISLDDLNYSLDDPSLFGNDPLTSIFQSDNKLYFLSGNPLEATIETGMMQPNAGRRTFVSGCTVITEASGMAASVETKERITDTGVFGTEETQEDTGVIPLHSSGRFVNLRVRIPEGEIWKTAQGIIPELSDGGAR